MRAALPFVLLVAVLSLASAARAATPGQAAPDFVVNDATGKPVRLADYRGKHVVLEWTNPECPFVRKHYDSANMQGLQKQYGAKDVVWLSVNSTNRNHPEYTSGAQMAAWMAKQGAAPKAVLIDDASATGRAYAARTTPHMFVIDPSGKIVYAGAIDDKRSANPADTKGAKNFVRAALDEALAGKPVSVASTTPYGCSVKY
jgi:cytochrome oxidase Cu insertion factor (SCO1/SenC/PrrC family)